MSNAAAMIAELNAAFKKEVVSTANLEVYKKGFWPTGIIPVDAALGGGVARGRMLLAAGESATLKSYIALTTAAQVQKQGGTAALFDVEHAFNPDWAVKAGVDIDQLILAQPETGEEAIDQIEVLVRKGIDYVIVDSIAALLPRAERDLMLSGKDHMQPALIARLMASGLRKINSANEKSAIFWISQMRDNIGAMAFAPKTNITGGKAIHFFISQSLVLKKTGRITIDTAYYDGEKDATDKRIVAQKFRVELSKSRNKQPFDIQHFVYDLVDGEVDQNLYLISEGLDMGYITRKGAWWNIIVPDENGEVILEEKAGSRDKFRELVATNETVKSTLLQRVCERYKLNPEDYSG